MRVVPAANSDKLLGDASKFGGRLPELDGLRGVAILLVMIFHFGYGIPGPRPGSILAYAIAPFVRLGWTGVDLFFVLSGYLIYNTLAQSRQRAGWIGAFYVRRAARVLPLYTVMLALFVAGVAAQSAGMIDLRQLFGSARQPWTYFLLVQNEFDALYHADLNFLSVSWSLCIEEHFYICFPLLFALVKSPKAFAGVLVTTAGLAILTRALPYVLNVGVGSDWQYYFSLCRLDGLAIGAGAALVAGTIRGSRLLGERRSWIALSAAVLAAGALLEAKWKSIFGIFTYTWFALLYGAVLLLVLTAFPGVRVLRSKVLIFLGNISYGLYLVHIPCLGLATALLWSSEADFLGQRPMSCTVVALFASFIAATASLYLFERPILDRVRAAQRQKRLADVPEPDVATAA